MLTFEVFLGFIILNYPSLTKTKTYYIVDDDIDDQQFLIEALTENNELVQCQTAFNGQDAITHLKEATIPLPDAIFLDLNMPGLNGKQCLMELKRTPSLQHIPVIIYSTTSVEKEIQETMQMGAAYFLIKRTSYKELLNELSLITAALNNEE
jgi:CheY-like chemotaxis protein